ncbi:MAG: glutathione peroxidase [Mycoplasma sp.]
MNIYDFKIEDNKGDIVDFSKYKNKVLLIVNTATKCGYTKQYSALQELFAKYHDKGFEILDFPCNQFFKQAPGSDAEIEQFCTLNFKTKFDRFTKIEVNGKNEHKLYKFLKENDNEKRGVKIKWNFTKFLISSDGLNIKRFDPADKPEDFETEIIKLLKNIT